MKDRHLIWYAALLLLLRVPASAASPWKAPPETGAAQPEPLPAFLQVLVERTKAGLFIKLPILDVDPNTGVTVGLTPVWVQTSSETIRFIHAVPAFYNTYAGASGAYHLIWFIARGESLQTRVSLSQKLDREAFIDYGNDALPWLSLGGRPVSVDGRVGFSKNGAQRFYGIGPAASRNDRSNYTLDTMNYRFSASVPVVPGSRWSVKLTHTLQANDVSNGNVESLPEFIDKFPREAASVTERRLDFSLRGALIFDGRDSAATTTSGTYGEAFAAAAHKEVLSEQSYFRWGGEIKRFIPWGEGKDGEPNFISGAYARLEHLSGTVPFWLMSQLGGRYVHRAYGAGRYIDHGLLGFGAEQRCHVKTFPGKKMPVSVWLDPFIGYGTVFPEVDLMRLKYVRPVYGLGLRFISRPQIVASAELGIGQEGAKVFLDINYSF